MVEYASSIFFKHQLSVIVELVSARIVTVVYDDVLILLVYEGGDNIFKVEIMTKPPMMNIKRSNIWITARIHLVFHVMCTFYHRIYPG